MKHVTVIAVEGCMASVVIGLFDILTIANYCQVPSRAKQNLPFFKIEIATPTGKNISSFNQVPVKPHLSINDVNSTDIIIIPPIAIDLSTSIEQNRTVISWLKKHHQRKAILASVCTGAFILAETGCLDGKATTTNQSVALFFKKKYPHIALNLQRIIVDNGDTLCAGATYSFRELAIYLIEKFCGHDTAMQVSKMFLIEKNRSSQAPYLIFQQQKGHADDMIREIQEWLEIKYSEDVTVAAMSSKFGLSQRSLTRRFKEATGDTLSIYLQRLRIESAKRKLETTRLNIDEITYAVGYEDSRSFSRLFKKHTSLSPGAYRQKFKSIID